MLARLLIAFIAAVLIAAAALRAHALSRSGAVAAGVLGTVVFGLGGWRWAVLLLGFFISASALSFLFKGRKAVYTEKFSKGSTRDAAQVAANGAVAGLFALISVFAPASPLPFLCAAAAFAAVNADTWATELGVLNPRPPRLITTFRVVEPGTSGGVSLFGTLAAFSGALLIGLLAALAHPDVTMVHALLIALAGLLGAVVDSLLGATAQAIYHCPACGKETERHPNHLCGAKTSHLRGWRWMNNDLVNFLCGLSAALVMLAVGG